MLWDRGLGAKTSASVAGGRHWESVSGGGFPQRSRRWHRRARIRRLTCDQKLLSRQICEPIAIENRRLLTVVVFLCVH